MKNKKTTKTSELVLKMVKSVCKAGVDMVTDLIIQILIQRVIPPKWRSLALLPTTIRENKTLLSGETTEDSCLLIRL